MLWLIAGFIGNGLAQFLQKYLHASGFGAYQSAALFAMYTAGALCGLALLLVFRGRVTRTELAGGIGVGICSYAGNYAVLRALADLPAYTVFPLIVGGPIVLVAAFSRFVWGERLSRSAQAGVALGLVAIVLLTVGS